MTILFLTTHNFVTNPRVVKEIKLAIAQGYGVHVICFEYTNWSKPINDILLNDLRNKASLLVIPSGRYPLFPWLISSFLSELAGKIVRFFPSSKWLLSLSSNKRSFLLLWHLKKVKIKIDLVVGHNIGAFYPSYIFSKKNKIPFGIDLEDYHAGETNNPMYAKKIKQFCKEILPEASYLTAASPLILHYSLKDIGSYQKKAVVINNTFSSSEFIIPTVKTEKKLRLVWFSQNIDKGRGLEQMVPVLKRLGDKIELHLYGNLKQDFFQTTLKHSKNIIIHQALPQEQLHKELTHYDVGLAIEPNKDINNAIAISNKINAYLQAGLYIIASDTPAQRKLIDEMETFGEIVFLNDENSVLDGLLHCLENMYSIRANAYERFWVARHYSWEEESIKLSKIWQEVIN